MVAVALGRARRVRLVDGLATAGAALYTALVARTLVEPSLLLFPLLALPAPLVAVLALTRRPLTTGVRLSVGWCVLTAAAVCVGALVIAIPLVAVALPLILVAFAFARRHPVPVIVATFVLTGSYGTWTAYGNLPAGSAVDLCLGAMWIAAIAAWLLRGPGRPAWLWPGVIFGAIFIVVGLIYAADAETVEIGVKWFRASIWYFAAALLVAYAPWPPGTRLRIARGALVVAALVGAYATLRWVTGPTGRERALGEQIQNNFLDNELRPIGSLTSPKELSSWCAMVLPFCFACVLAFRDRWRLVAAAGCVFLTTAMFAADVRAAPIGAAAGLAIVLVLFVLAQAFSGGHKTGVAVLAVAALAIGGTAAYAVTLGGKDSSAQRFSNIFNPSQDPSVAGRTFKWRTAIADIEESPLGHGAGSAGRTARLNRFASIGQIDIDNSYLKIAYEQGFAVMAIFAAAALLLLAGLVRRAVTTPHPMRAALAIGAAGTLLSMLVLFFAAENEEGLPALAGWLLVGIGIGQFTFSSRADAQ